MREAKARKTYRSDALRSTYSVAEDLYAVGAIDEATMRRFDERCLVRPQLKKAREKV